MNLLEELEFRGLIYQLTDPEGLGAQLRQGSITLYNGFDPTADSLHIGNLLAILLLRRFQLAGHTPIALVGGGTGLIGDPGGKTEERALNPRATVEAWSGKIKGQLEPLLDFEAGSNAALMVDNYEWLGEIKAIDFMREVGKHFSVPYMLAKDSVAARLETGISYTEFSYMILQAYDFLRLSERYDCRLQTGGSDQWGNITAGADLIRRVAGKKVYGLTCPLLTRADGGKFGKTESGTIWLDPQKTSPYQFYQFWINSGDQSVVDYLKHFTFLSRDEILNLEEEVRQRPEKRTAQRALAQALTTLIHGEDNARRAEKISQALFYGEVRKLEEDEIEEGFGEVPTCEMSRAELSLLEVLVEARICSSRRQAREDLEKGAIYLNGERSTEPGRMLRRSEGLHGKYFILRRGKNRYFLIK